MSFDRESRMWAPLWLMCAAVVLFPATTLAEAAPGSLEAEIEYIDALSNNGYPDFTEAVIEAAQKKWPDAGGVLKAAQIRAQLSGGKQDEVAKEIAKRPDQNSLETGLLKLELARSYYAYSKFAEADKIYADFFKRFTKVPDSAKRSYVNAALTYVQMLNKLDRAKDCLPYYKLAMEQAPDEEIQLFVRADYLKALLAQAELLQGGEREKLLKDADAIANQMVWRQDPYFGDAINGLAHVKMLRGDVKGAQEMIKNYLKTLMDIHEEYKKNDPDGSKGILRMSPLPQCRYLIGSMLYKEAQAEIAKDKPDEERIKNLLLGERDPKTRKRNGQGALNHLVNVYTNYPESQSAAAAGEAMNAIVKIIKDRYDTVVKFSTTPEQDAKVRQAQYVEADVKFDSGDWKGAAEAYSRVISRYGLNAEALPRLGKMIQCYVRGGTQGSTLSPDAEMNARTVALAVAEGFSGVPDRRLRDAAGSEVGRIADFFGEVGLKQLQREVNGAFFRYYPSHPDAARRQLDNAQVLAKSETAGDVDQAIRILTEIKDKATEPSQFDVRRSALAQLIAIHSPSGARPDVVAELKCATELVTHFKQAAKPGIVGASAQLSLAAAYQHAGDTYRKAKNTKGATLTYTRAAQTYEELIAELAKPDSRFVTTAEERAKVPTFVSQAQIYRGYCLQRIPATGDEAADKARRDEALACYTDLLKRNPKDALAPHALLQVGTILSGNDDVAGARRALDQLRKEFPESKEAKNAIPMLAAALASSGRTKQAAETYAEMFGNTAAYSTAQFMDAARALDEAGQYGLAVQACDIVLKSGAAAYETAAMLLRTRTLNSAALEAKDDATAAENATKAYLQLEALMEKYGRTTVAIDAELALVTDVAPTVIGLLPKSPALCEAVVFKGTPKDDRPADAQAARNALISEVKNAVKFVTAQRKDYVTAAQLNLAVAQVAEKGFVAARDNGAEPEALREAAGSALNAYTVAMSPGVNPETRQVVPVDDPAVTGYVQAAYVGYIRLAGERARLGADDADRKAFFGDVVTFGNDYLAKFPNGKDAGYVKTQVQIAAQND
ncbi:MAG TPA: hypothetical protein IAC79_02780 [Candidatus Spyradenecus faecavium]|mgnify:FL=1|uniref:Tetratricopeptide repeat protein n=1 Tax=Candidatus Spyradenecus faecavium TaxID=2840947 RepID=A0A9D1T235_9BACT|nr:hypothetical protein [Candidatus Spyradenecus faecavium]